jgi:omega-6 fatty acid desaturase (delta-12 desaturase)
MSDLATSQSAATAEDAARAWRASLPSEYRHRSDLYGMAIFAFSAVLYILTFLGMFLLPTWWLQLAALLTNPIIIGALFVISHDACHGILVQRGWLNRLLGRLAMLTAWHPFTSWAHAHNTMHHGWTNFKGRHPDFSPFTKAEFDALPHWRQWLERIYRNPLGIGLYYTIDFYVWRLLFPPRDNRSSYRLFFHLDRLLVASFLLVQLLVAWQLAEVAADPVLPPALHALVAVFVPWVLWIWFMGFVSFIQHTHERLPWYNNEQEWSFYRAQLKSTVHVIFPWPIERVLHNIMDHPAHHIDPTIPLYSLPQSQRLLETQFPEHAEVVYWTPWDYWHTCAACKLYDFERHCWLNFKGEPTTPFDLCGPREKGSGVVSDKMSA